MRPPPAQGAKEYCGKIEPIDHPSILKHDRNSSAGQEFGGSSDVASKSAFDLERLSPRSNLVELVIPIFPIAPSDADSYDSVMSAMTREKFVEEILKIVPAKFPLVKLARGDEPFSLRVNGNVISLENLYRMAILQPEEMKRHIERWMVEIIRASEGTPDRQGTYEDLKERILPMILPEEAGEVHADTLSEPLIDGLRIAYAIDRDRTIAYIPKSQFE